MSDEEQQEPEASSPRIVLHLSKSQKMNMSQYKNPGLG